MTKTRRIAAVAALALLAACGTEVVNPVTGRAERTVMDVGSEIAEGAKAHPEILKEYGAYANPRLQAYVDGIGQRLAYFVVTESRIYTVNVDGSDNRPLTAGMRPNSE